MYEENTLYPSAVNQQNNFIFRTFLWMFIGLAVTAVCAWITYESGLFWYFFYENTFTTLLVIELVVVIAFSFLFRKLPPIAVGILFFAYAVLNGVTLSVIFILYQMSSIVILFLAGAALFGGFAIYGYKTTSDMTRFGPMLMITLIIAVVISLINIFLLKSGRRHKFLMAEGDMSVPAFTASHIYFCPVCKHNAAFLSCMPVHIKRGLQTRTFGVRKVSNYFSTG